jgi:hypothetical protein
LLFQGGDAQRYCHPHTASIFATLYNLGRLRALKADRLARQASEDFSKRILREVEQERQSSARKRDRWMIAIMIALVISLTVARFTYDGDSYQCVESSRWEFC